MLNNIPVLSRARPVFDERIYMAKVDHQFNDIQRVSGHYNHNYRIRNNSPAGRWGARRNCRWASISCRTPGRMVRLAYDWTISTNLLNHVAIGWHRFGNRNESVYVDQDWPERIGLRTSRAHTSDPRLGGTADAGRHHRRGRRRRLGQSRRELQRQYDPYGRPDGHPRRVKITRSVSNCGSTTSPSGTSQAPATSTSPAADRTAGLCEEHPPRLRQLPARRAAEHAPRVSPNNFGYRVTPPSFHFMDDWKATTRLTLNLGCAGS